jgi:hypothetical protein
MPWIESHQELRQHWKVQGLALALGVSRATAIGHLHLLWWWAIDYAPNGNLSRFPASIIAQAAEWTGDPGLFADALRANELQDEDGMIHDWWSYAGKLIEKRRLDRERKAKVRETSVGSPAEVAGNPPDSVGSRDDSTTYSTEQEIREENSTNQDRSPAPSGDQEGRVLVGRYLRRLVEHSPAQWTKVSDQDLIEIGQDEGFSILATGRLLGGVWDWWRSVTPSKRWGPKGVLRGFRTWCKRDRENREKSATAPTMDQADQPKPPPLPPSLEELAAMEAEDRVHLEDVTHRAAASKLEIPVEDIGEEEIRLYREIVAEEEEARGRKGIASALRKMAGRVGQGVPS